MKAAFAYSLLFLAGSVSCNPAQGKTNWPDWFPDLPEGIVRPEWWPETIPPHPDWVPEWVWPPNIPSLPEGGIDWGAIQWPEKPEWLPEIDWEALEKPDWWPDWSEIEKPDININKPVPGTPTSITEFPGIVQVEVGSESIWAQGCVGNILTSRHVLTAARCFSGRLYDNRFRRIRAGSGSRSTDGSVINVDNVIVHPSFGDAENQQADIAVVRLVTFLLFSPNIQQTSIVAPGFNLPGGLPVVHAGWGSTAEGNKIANRDLHQINLVSVSSVACSELWDRLIPLGIIKISSDKICAAQPETGGRDTDPRDIGAPIFYDNILVGIVSFGAPIGNHCFPVVATAVSPYTNWIVDNAL